MKKIWLAAYKLIQSQSGGSRLGYLLKLKTSEFSEGYADIFPWTEFGDPSFEEIPKLLQQEHIAAPLLQKSLYFAEKDGLARHQDKALLGGHKIKNHYLVEKIYPQSALDILRALDMGFDRLKLKVGRDWNKEIHLLQSLSPSLKGAKWRLDCNLNGQSLDWNLLEPFRDQIEFIEDPFPEPNKWSERWPWAYDQPRFPQDQVRVAWQVIKPAKQSLNNLDEQKKIVVTSYMDHPVGVAHALAEAQEYVRQDHDFGLMTLSMYENTPFHEHFCCEGPWLWMEPQKGIGFTDLLKRQNWVAI